MKRVISAFLFLALFQSAASAQVNYHGPAILHRDAVSSVDTWFGTAQTAPRSGSEELKGYDSVRIDANVTGTDVSIVCNLACSNDSLWVSGDSLTFTKDSYQDVSLQGCADYYVNLDSVSSGDSASIYLTGFNN